MKGRSMFCTDNSTEGLVLNCSSATHKEQTNVFLHLKNPCAVKTVNKVLTILVNHRGNIGHSEAKSHVSGKMLLPGRVSDFPYRGIGCDLLVKDYELEFLRL